MSEIEQYLAPSRLEKAAAATLRHQVGGAGVLKDCVPSTKRVFGALQGNGKKLYLEEPEQTA